VVPTDAFSRCLSGWPRLGVVYVLGRNYILFHVLAMIILIDHNLYEFIHLFSYYFSRDIDEHKT
jgi:hypothetical protein